SCEIRLVDWIEGQYKNTDKPNPRGEILIGGKVVADGYFGEAGRKENENFKEIEGTRYFCTGDIGECFPDGTLKIIDRKKDLVKLRGGEYVSLTKVEMAMSKIPIIENCCLCASASSEYTVALICPNTKTMSNFTEKNFGEKDWHKLVNDDEFIELVLKEVQQACNKGGIERFETPQKIKIVTEPWTPETGLVTDALKLKRKAIEQKYKDDIEDLYEERKAKPKSETKKIRKTEEKKITSNENPTDVAKDVISNDNEKKKEL
ncbi:unnamed protein product, partial [Adineta ricciae]